MFKVFRLWYSLQTFIWNTIYCFISESSAAVTVYNSTTITSISSLLYSQDELWIRNWFLQGEDIWNRGRGEWKKAAATGAVGKSAQTRWPRGWVFTDVLTAFEFHRFSWWTLVKITRHIFYFFWSCEISSYVVPWNLFLHLLCDME